MDHLKQNNSITENHPHVCQDCKKELCISQIEMFKDLNLADSKKLCLAAIHKEYNKGEILFEVDDPIDKIIIIRYGKLKTSIYDEAGHEYIRNIFIGGDTIGEDNIFAHKNYDLSGIAIEKTGVCIISLDSIKNLLFNNPDFALKMIENLSTKLYQSQNLLEILAIKDAYKRLAAFLLYRSKMLGQKTVELNQENIASSINLTRETVSRKMKELEEDGYIKLIAYKKIQISNYLGLVELAKP